MIAYGVFKVSDTPNQSLTSTGQTQIVFNLETTDRQKSKIKAVLIASENKLDVQKNSFLTAKLDQLIAVVNRKEKFIFANVAEIISITTNPN